MVLAADEVQQGLLPEAGRRDKPTVTSEGAPLDRTIDGVVLRVAKALPDERGEVVELLTAGWSELCGETIPHVYLVTLEPGVVKGWVCHREQTDRVVVVFGRARWVLYDGREQSSTHGVVQQLTVTERNRQILMIPAGVWHAVENVGTREASFVNMPTAAYRHDDPDKYRLPLDTPLIPFSFATRR